MKGVFFGSSKTSSRSVPGLEYRSWLILGYLLVALLCGLGISAEFRNADQNVETLALERGSVLFRLVELTRDWNAEHGGVYVPVTEKTRPNPYLHHPKRDLLTTDGSLLTMINPAFMTRQIAEIAERTDGVKYHITSHRPIRPENAADPWEMEALLAFETRGVKEVLTNERDFPVPNSRRKPLAAVAAMIEFPH